MVFLFFSIGFADSANDYLDSDEIEKKAIEVVEEKEKEISNKLKDVRSRIRMFSAVDLSKLNWKMKQGFDISDKNGFSDFEKEQNTFPLVLNTVFDISPKREVKHFTVSAEFKLSPDDIKSPRPLAIFFPAIGENWEVYLNGNLIHHEIHIDKDGDIAINRTLVNAVIPFNKSLLKSSKNILVIHFVGYSPVLPILDNPDLGFARVNGYKIDSLDRINWENSEILNMYMNGMTILFGIFFIVFYFITKERYNIYNGFLCLMVSIRFFFMSQYAYELIFNTSIIRRFELASTYMLVPPLLYFLRNMFYKKDLKFLLPLRIIGSVSVLFALTNFFLPYRMVTTVFRLWQFASIPLMIFVVFFIIGLFHKNRGDAANVAIYTGIVILGGIWDNFDSVFFQTGIKMLEPAMFIFLLRFAIISIKKFVNMTKETQRLNVELTKQKNAFYRFVPVNFLDKLNHESAVDIEAGDSIGEEMSILFSDIRSFTTISERLNPAENFRFLNEYLSEMEPCIRRNKGFVDKYIGDAVLALYGEIESETSTSAERSVKSAIEMQNALKKLNKKRIDNGEIPLRIGVGINTGPLMLGTLGNENRLDTTVIGNTVNLASRLESLTSYYKVPILISEYTLGKINSEMELFYRQIDNVIVKGKSEPVKIYEVFNSDSNEEIETKLKLQPHFEKGFEYYTKGDFKAAHKSFVNAYKINPEDPVVKILAIRCQKLMKKPPKGKWNGIYKYSSKTGE